MYHFPLYSRLHADHSRLNAFRDAMAQVIKPGDTVLELGAGPGIFGVMAAKAGAARVFAVDPSGYVDLAGKAAVLNGVQDRLQVHKCLTTEWTPDAPIDVVLHDIKGTLPAFKSSLASLIDIRKRVAPRATLVPRRDLLYAALVSASQLRADFIDAWTHCDPNVNAQTYTDVAINLCYGTTIKNEMIASDVNLLGTLDYRSELMPDVEMSTSWTIGTDSVVDGVGAWFDCDMADGITYTAGPNNPTSVYGQCFFPFREPLSLTAGDEVAWRVNAMDSGSDYVWWWSTKARLRSGQVLHFRQGDVNMPREPAIAR